MLQTSLLLMPGAMEILPELACPKDVLEAEGQLLQSKTIAGTAAQLFWTASSAYLVSQINAFCSHLSGELIRGDAVIIAEHTNQGAAQDWLAYVKHKQQSLCSTMNLQSLSQFHIPDTDPDPASTVDQTCSKPQSGCQAIQASPNRSNHSAQALEHGEHVLNNRVAEHMQQLSDTSQNLGGSRGEDSEPTEACAAHATNGNTASICESQCMWPEDLSDPRKTLMHAIMGQASSITWRQSPEKPGQWQSLLENGSAPQSDTLAQAERSTIGETAWLNIAQADHSIIRNPDTAASEPAVVDSEPSMHTRLSQGGGSASQWEDLPAELVVKIAQHTDSALTIQLMMNLCRHWQTSILEDPGFLKQIPFQLPLKRRIMTLCTERFCQPRRISTPITRLADSAAKAGNMNANVLIAEVFKRITRASESAPYARRAAKLGHADSQLWYGLAMYTGKDVAGKDCEEAHRWLSKAAYQYLLKESSQGLAEGEKVCLSIAALHLGFLELDGEGVKIDRENAVYWFKIASEHGCTDADLIMGTLMRTGQYGPV